MTPKTRTDQDLGDAPKTASAGSAVTRFDAAATISADASTGFAVRSSLPSWPLAVAAPAVAAGVLLPQLVLVSSADDELAGAGIAAAEMLVALVAAVMVAADSCCKSAVTADPKP